MKTIGYLVMEACDDYEQALVIRTGGGLPMGGILDWPQTRTQSARAVFTSRTDAHAAIARTEHYRLAFGRTNLPEKKFCSVAPVCSAPSTDGGGI